MADDPQDPRRLRIGLRRAEQELAKTLARIREDEGHLQRMKARIDRALRAPPTLEQLLKALSCREEEDSDPPTAAAP